MKYEYKVSGIKVYSEEGKADIIKEATLHIIGTQGSDTFENFLPIELAEPSGSFKEFSEVSESQVIEWLKETHGEDQIVGLDKVPEISQKMLDGQLKGRFVVKL